MSDQQQPPQSGDGHAYGPPGSTPPPPSYGGVPPYPDGGNDPMEGKGDGNFFAALFDFSFSTFVTPIIVKVVYVLATIALGLTYVIFVISSFASDQPAAGLVVLVVGAIVFLIYLAFIRMTLEFYYAIVRMSQDINRRLPGA